MHDFIRFIPFFHVFPSLEISNLVHVFASVTIWDNQISKIFQVGGFGLLGGLRGLVNAARGAQAQSQPSAPSMNSVVHQTADETTPPQLNHNNNNVTQTPNMNGGQRPYNFLSTLVDTIKANKSSDEGESTPVPHQNEHLWVYFWIGIVTG